MRAGCFKPSRSKAMKTQMTAQVTSNFCKAWQLSSLTTEQVAQNSDRLSASIW